MAFSKPVNVRQFLMSSKIFSVELSTSYFLFWIKQVSLRSDLIIHKRRFEVRERFVGGQGDVPARGGCAAPLAP